MALLEGKVSVPGVNGLTPDAAAAALDAAELRQGRSTSTTACGPSDNGKVASATPAAGSPASSCQASRGSVLTQGPSGGTRIVPGSAVNLTESTGKQPSGKTCPIT